MGADAPGGSGGDDFPLHTDFARNFSEEAVDSSLSASDDVDTDYYYSGDDGEGASAEEEPLEPGLYRVLYVFNPEGTRGCASRRTSSCVSWDAGVGGWSVVVHHPPGGGKEVPVAADEAGFEMERHALVPESYLELVKPDTEDREEEEGGCRRGDIAGPLGTCTYHTFGLGHLCAVLIRCRGRPAGVVHIFTLVAPRGWGGSAEYIFYVVFTVSHFAAHLYVYSGARK